MFMSPSRFTAPLISANKEKQMAECNLNAADLADKPLHLSARCCRFNSVSLISSALFPAAAAVSKIALTDALHQTSHTHR